MQMKISYKKQVKSKHYVQKFFNITLEHFIKVRNGMLFIPDFAVTYLFKI